MKKERYRIERSGAQAPYGIGETIASGLTALQALRASREWQSRPLIRRESDGARMRYVPISATKDALEVAL